MRSIAATTTSVVVASPAVAASRCVLVPADRPCPMAEGADVGRILVVHHRIGDSPQPCGGRPAEQPAKRNERPGEHHGTTCASLSQNAVHVRGDAGRRGGKSPRLAGKLGVVRGVEECADQRLDPRSRTG
jgi:hypothetical protein